MSNHQSTKKTCHSAYSRGVQKPQTYWDVAQKIHRIRVASKTRKEFYEKTVELRRQLAHLSYDKPTSNVPDVAPVGEDELGWAQRKMERRNKREGKNENVKIEKLNDDIQYEGHCEEVQFEGPFDFISSLATEIREPEALIKNLCILLENEWPAFHLVKHKFVEEMIAFNRSFSARMDSSKYPHMTAEDFFFHTVATKFMTTRQSVSQYCSKSMYQPRPSEIMSYCLEFENVLCGCTIEEELAAGNYFIRPASRCVQLGDFYKRKCHERDTLSAQRKRAIPGHLAKFSLMYHKKKEKLLSCIPQDSIERLMDIWVSKNPFSDQATMAQFVFESVCAINSALDSRTWSGVVSTFAALASSTASKFFARESNIAALEQKFKEGASVIFSRIRENDASPAQMEGHTEILMEIKKGIRYAKEFKNPEHFPALGFLSDLVKLYTYFCLGGAELENPFLVRLIESHTMPEDKVAASLGIAGVALDALDFVFTVSITVSTGKGWKNLISPLRFTTDYAGHMAKTEAILDGNFGVLYPEEEEEDYLRSFEEYADNLEQAVNLKLIHPASVAQHVSYLHRVKVTQNAIVMKSLEGKDKQMPYAIILAGSPGIGKTGIRSNIEEIFHHEYNNGVPFKPHEKVKVDAKQKYVENWDSGKKYVHFLEVGNTTSKEENAFDNCTMNIDNNVNMLDSAIATKKGKNPNMSLCMLAETNDMSCGILDKVTSPGAFGRRWRCAETRVKKQWGIMDPCGNFVPNTKLIKAHEEAMQQTHPGYRASIHEMRFYAISQTDTLERFSGDGSKGESRPFNVSKAKVQRVILTDWLDITSGYKFIRDDIVEHKRKQNLYLEELNGVKMYCNACACTSGLCRCAKPEFNVVHRSAKETSLARKMYDSCTNRIGSLYTRLSEYYEPNPEFYHLSNVIPHKHESVKMEGTDEGTFPYPLQWILFYTAAIPSFNISSLYSNIILWFLCSIMRFAYYCPFIAVPMVTASGACGFLFLPYFGVLASGASILTVVLVKSALMIKMRDCYHRAAMAGKGLIAVGSLATIIAALAVLRQVLVMRVHKNELDECLEEGVCSSLLIPSSKEEADERAAQKSDWVTPTKMELRPEGNTRNMTPAQKKARIDKCRHEVRLPGSEKFRTCFQYDCYTWFTYIHEDGLPTRKGSVTVKFSDDMRNIMNTQVVDWWRMEDNHDMVWFRCVSGRPTKGLAGMFVEEVVDSVMVEFAYPSTDSKVQRSLITLVNLPSPGKSYPVGRVVREIRSQKGDCLTPYFTKKDGLIAGLHIAGSREGAFAYFVKTTETAMKKAASHRTPNFPLIQYEGLVDIPMVTVPKYDDEIHSRSCLKYLRNSTEDDGEYGGNIDFQPHSVEYFGTDLSQQTTPISRVRINPLSANLEKNGIRRDHGKQTFSARKTFSLYCQRNARSKLDFPFETMKKGFDCYIEQLCEGFERIDFKFSLLTDEENANGIMGDRYVKKVDPTKSAGYGMKGKKGDPEYMTVMEEVQSFTPELQESIDFVIERWSRGKSTPMIIKMLLKDEPTDSLKNRLMGTPSMVHQMAIRKLCTNVLAGMRKIPLESLQASGINASGEEWDEMVSHISAFDRVNAFAGDFSKMDSTITHANYLLIMRLFRTIINRFWDEDQHTGGLSKERCLVAMDTMWFDIATAFCHWNGDLVRFPAGNKSGLPPTVEVNGLTIIMEFAAMFKMLPGNENLNPFDHLAMTTLGDDHEGSTIETRFHQKYIADCYAKRGVKYTDPTKAGEVQEWSEWKLFDYDGVDFCKRGHVYDQRVNGIMAPLSLQSIRKMLHCIMPTSEDDLEVTLGNYRVAIRELGRHDQETFESWRSSMKKTLGDHGLISCVPEIEWGYSDWGIEYNNKYWKHKNLPIAPHTVQITSDAICFEGVSSMQSDDRSATAVEPPLSQNKWFETKQQTQTGVMQIESPLESQPGGFQAVHDTNADQAKTSQTIDSMIGRTVKIASIQWNPNQDMHEVINPFELLLLDPMIGNRVAHYKLMRMSCKIQFMWNANLPYHGLSYACLNPMHNFDDFLQARPYQLEDDVELTQRPKVFLNASTSQTGELNIPYIFHKDMVDLTKNEHLELSRVIVRSLSPLRHVQGLTTPLTISVFATVTEFELSLPTGKLGSFLRPQFEGLEDTITMEGDEYGMISGPAQVVADVAGALSNVPYIGKFAKATNMVATMGVGAAKMFGFSKPRLLGIENTRLRAAGTTATVDDQDGARTLALMTKHELTIDPATMFSTDEDVLALSGIARRPAFINRFTLDENMNSEDTVFSMPIMPFLGQKDSNGDYHVCPGAFAALPFKYWKGTTVLRVIIPATQFHKAKLRFGWDPCGTPDPTKHNTYYSEILDLDTVFDVTFRIGWGEQTPYKYCIEDMNQISSGTQGDTVDNSFHNGVFAMSVVNPLVSIKDDERISLDVIVMASFEDFEVAAPRNLITDVVIAQDKVFPISGTIAPSDGTGSKSAAVRARRTYPLQFFMRPIREDWEVPNTLNADDFLPYAPVFNGFENQPDDRWVVMDESNYEHLFDPNEESVSTETRDIFTVRGFVQGTVSVQFRRNTFVGRIIPIINPNRQVRNTVTIDGISDVQEVFLPSTAVGSQMYISSGARFYGAAVTTTTYASNEANIETGIGSFLYQLVVNGEGVDPHGVNILEGETKFLVLPQKPLSYVELTISIAPNTSGEGAAFGSTESKDRYYVGAVSWARVMLDPSRIQTITALGTVTIHRIRFLYEDLERQGLEDTIEFQGLEATDSMGETSPVSYSMGPRPVADSNASHIGEVVASFRTLLKRYATRSIIVTNQSIGSISVPFYPLTYKTTPFSSEPSTIIKVNEEFPHLMDYVCRAFLAIRGSCRMKIVDINGGTGTITITREGTRSGFLPSMALKNSGTEVNSNRVSPVSEIELPWYSLFKFGIARAENRENIFQERAEISGFWGDAQRLNLVYAAAEDFTCAHFLSTPLLREL